MNLTNLDKIYWPKEKITKGDLLSYYATIAKYILPYLKNRPIVLHRFPNGIQGDDFYQKDIKEKLPSFVKTAEVVHKEKKIRYLLIQNAQSLLYAVNLGSIELHPFNSSLKSLQYPDYMALDLDPIGVSFDKVVDVALTAHELLTEAKIPSYCKTSGGRGLHIYIPLGAKYEYAQIKDFGYLLATMIHERMTSLTSLERKPQKRQKKVYLDYLQNLKGQTFVCPYSVRGKPYATVATPLEWKEVKHGLSPLDFTLKTTPKRLSQKGDLFKGILGKGIDLHKCLNNLEKL